MTESRNKAVPVIVGVVGDATGLSSLAPVFEEFRRTFRNSTPIMVMQVEALGAVKLFEENKPDSSSELNPMPSKAGGAISVQDMATYMLRNCHFVLLPKQEDISTALQAIRSAVEAHAIELPANMPSAGNENISVFDLPEPAPVLIQTKENSLELEIVKRKHCETGDAFKLDLFQYEQRKTGIRKFKNELTGKPCSTFASQGSQQPFEFHVCNIKPLSETDPLGSRWLNCVEGLHRLAEFNAEPFEAESKACQANEYHPLDRLGFEIKPDGMRTIPEGLALMSEVFLKADVLAQGYQTLWQKLRYATIRDISKGGLNLVHFDSFLFLAAIAAFLLAFSIDFGYVWKTCWHGLTGPVTYVVYAFILIISFVYLYRKARIARWEQKHQDYRFIAEVLAIQTHWLRAGIRQYVSDHFPMGVKNDVQWVRRTLHTVRFLSNRDITPILSPDRICEKWIGKNEKDNQGQLYYHMFTLQRQRKKALHELERHRRFWGWAFVVLFSFLAGYSCYEILTTLFGAYGVAMNCIQIHDVKHFIELVHPWITVFMVTSLVIFALLGEAIEGYGIKKELTRSEELVAVYRRCLSEFASPSADEKRKRELLEHVGRFAIDAEANWLVLHRERPMQPVKGG